MGRISRLLPLLRQISGVLLFFSGIGFLAFGVLTITSGWIIRTTSTNDREPDRVLAEKVCEEALARGDPEYLASFYQSDTEHMSDDSRAWGMMTIGFGAASLITGVGIIIGWWYVATQFIG